MCVTHEDEEIDYSVRQEQILNTLSFAVVRSKFKNEDKIDTIHNNIDKYRFIKYIDEDDEALYYMLSGIGDETKIAKRILKENKSEVIEVLLEAIKVQGLVI